MTAHPFVPCTRYLDRMVLLPGGSPIVLAKHQRRILDHIFTLVHGRFRYQSILWSEPKKSGKTQVAAAVGSWVLNTQGPRAEVPCVGNDFEQSCARVFAEIVRIQQAHSTLKSRIVKATERVLLLNDGSRAYPVALDAAGEAGSEPSCTLHDEAWGIVSEEARRLYDELTPPPTRQMAFRWVSSYAGFSGESKTLEALWARGQAGRPIPGLPDCTANGPLFAFISHTPRMPWQLGLAGERYYRVQEADLRPSAFLRLHKNEWPTGESIYIPAQLWDSCTLPDLRPPLPSHDLTLFGGIDAGIKSDFGAVLTVFYHRDKLALGPWRMWRPTQKDPLDLEQTIETYVRELHARYTLAAVLADPYQMHRSITTLAAAGIPIQEFPQSTPNQTRAGQALYEVLKGGNLELYADAALREQAMNTVAVESSRGWRIAKEKASRKIDSIVALSMAVVAALDGRPAQPSESPPEGSGLRASFFGPGGPGRLRDLAEPASAGTRVDWEELRQAGW